MKIMSRDFTTREKIMLLALAVVEDHVRDDDDDDPREASEFQIGRAHV